MTPTIINALQEWHTLRHQADAIPEEERREGIRVESEWDRIRSQLVHAEAGLVAALVEGLVT